MEVNQSVMNVLLINCDKTYSFDSVEDLVKCASDGNIPIEKQYCNVSELQAVSEEVRRRELLCGVLVVNAYESRLSINEDRAGIGYAVLYRALLEAAQGRVLVVIGGDDRYKAGEQDTSVLSTWAYHKIAAQFDDTYLDGRRGFVFSWDERHNPVHQEALGSYLRAITSGQPGLQQPFTPRVPPKPEKPSTKEQATTIESAQTETPSETAAENFPQQQHPGTQGPSHTAPKQTDQTTTNKSRIDVETFQSKRKTQVDNSTHVVYEDPLGAASYQTTPPAGVKSNHPESKESVPNQACVLPSPLAKALISELFNKKIEPRAAEYLKNKMEKEAEGRKVRVIQIFDDGEVKRYDYPKGEDAFPIPADVQKRINERKDREEVVIVAIYEDKPPKGQSRGQVNFKSFNLTDLVDATAQHLREKLDTEGRIVKVIQTYENGELSSNYHYPASDNAFPIPSDLKQSINEEIGKGQFVVVVICDDGPGEGLSRQKLGLESYDLSELLYSFIQYLDIWHDVA